MTSINPFSRCLFWLAEGIGLLLALRPGGNVLTPQKQIDFDSGVIADCTTGGDEMTLKDGQSSEGLSVLRPGYGP